MATSREVDVAEQANHAEWGKPLQCIQRRVIGGGGLQDKLNNQYSDRASSRPSNTLAVSLAAEIPAQHSIYGQQRHHYVQEWRCQTTMGFSQEGVGFLEFKIVRAVYEKQLVQIFVGGFQDEI